MAMGHEIHPKLFDADVLSEITKTECQKAVAAYGQENAMLVASGMMVRLFTELDVPSDSQLSIVGLFDALSVEMRATIEKIDNHRKGKGK